MTWPETAKSATQPYPRPSIEGGRATPDQKPARPPILTRDEIARLRQLLKEKQEQEEAGAT